MPGYHLLPRRNIISRPLIRNFCLCLPKRLILVRHAESVGNVDERAYETTPDWVMPLTENGKEQARRLGVELKQLLKDDKIFIYCSPYKRSKQTLKRVMKSFEDAEIVDAREDPRLVEQQFGNIQRLELMSLFKSDRSKFGRFHYCFPNGESGLDVYIRVTGFISTLFRDWSKIDPEVLNDMTVLIITHGLTLRLFLMRWLHYSVEEFEASTNPGNCDFVCLDRYETQDKFNPVRFRLCDHGHELCNLPRKAAYMKKDGRKNLQRLLQDSKCRDDGYDSGSSSD